MSFKGGKQGGRRYSVVEDRDVSIAKALMFVLKRTITEDQVDEEEKVDNLVEDSEGWVNLGQLVSTYYSPWPHRSQRTKLTYI